MAPHILVLSLRSPFARRVRLALLRLGIPFEMQLENVFEPTPALFEANPLGLVPSIRTPEGEFLTDSAMILEHLDEAQGHRIWPRDPQARLKVRRGSVWAEGVMTATVTWFLESLRGEKSRASEEWMAEQSANIRRTLERVQVEGARGLPWIQGKDLTQAGWDLAVALEYLEMRLPHLKWRENFPSLVPVLEIAQTSSAFRETAPPPA